MRDPKNLTIALLCVSAAILGTALLLSMTVATPAYGETPVRAGDYILLTGAYSDSTDLIYVTDVAAQKINTYVFNPASNELLLRDQFNLVPAFK